MRSNRMYLTVWSSSPDCSYFWGAHASLVHDGWAQRSWDSNGLWQVCVLCSLYPKAKKYNECDLYVWDNGHIGSDLFTTTFAYCSQAYYVTLICCRDIWRLVMLNHFLYFFCSPSILWWKESYVFACNIKMFAMSLLRLDFDAKIQSYF